MMPHQRCCEVLRDTCSLALGDESLTGRVEHCAAELWVTSAKVSIPLHNLVHCKIREHPARRWKSGIQQLLHHPMQRHLPLCGLRLEQTNSIGPDADKPP